MMRIALKGHGGDAVALIDGVEYKTVWVDANLYEVDVRQVNLSGVTGHDIPLGLRLYINRCEVEDEGHPLFDTWLLSRNQHRLIIEAWADGS
ncbi:MAG: hypothetical protein K0R39_1526, partial [Symbiobacteriaceae bacterium]|nr:hypothetical protein [Symbiobacteriaceae bacterium]